MDRGNGHFHKVMEFAPSVFLYPQILRNPTDNWKQGKDLHITQPITAMGKRNHTSDKTSIRQPVTGSFNPARLIT